MESGGLPSGDVVTAGKRPSHLVGWPFYNMWSGGVPRDEEFQENGNGAVGGDQRTFPRPFSCGRPCSLTGVGQVSLVLHLAI